mmetsp:Transcript_97475/g.170072  ORF Transcript_97475/g.170072 Transcript_97475/m.170072 type:complete len:204 (+) Transcript_97475:1129-1740(+)
MINMICIQPFHSSVCSRCKGLELSKVLTVHRATTVISTHKPQKRFGSCNFFDFSKKSVRSHRYKNARMAANSAAALSGSTAPARGFKTGCSAGLPLSEASRTPCSGSPSWSANFSDFSHVAVLSLLSSSFDTLLCSAAASSLGSATPTVSGKGSLVGTSSKTLCPVELVSLGSYKAANSAITQPANAVQRAIAKATCDCVCAP